MPIVPPLRALPRLTTLLVVMVVVHGGMAQTEFLVKDGQPSASIVVPVDAPPQVERAAEILRDYMERSTGASLPVVREAQGVQIHVGETALVQQRKLIPAGLTDDGFILQQAGPGHFVIAGRTTWGTEFGVYEFLERYLGVRWLAPTELFTVVPRRGDLSLPAGSHREDPVYLSREFFPIEPHRETIDPVRDAPPRWYTAADHWGRKNKLHAHVDFHHNLLELIPGDKFGQSHPEFFPLIKGERVIPPDGVYYQWQPNFSAPGIVEAAAGEIRAYFEENPDKTSYSFGVNDSHRYDESPESKARRSGKTNSIGLEDVSDDYYLWVNQVAAEVLKTHRGKKFGLLAYLEVLEPPVKGEMNSAVVPFLTFEMTRWGDEVSRGAIELLTKQWKAVSPELGWYDYPWGCFYILPRPLPYELVDALKWGTKHGVKHYYAEMLPSWGEGPKAWALAKLLWNPNQDVDALLHDWYVAAAGEKAAPKLKAYFDLWEAFWREEARRSPWYTPASLWLDFNNLAYIEAVPEALIAQSEELIQQAVALAGTEDEKARVRALQQMWQIYRATALAYPGNGIWKNADLPTEADALAYLKKCQATMNAAQERLQLLSDLGDDPLLGHAVFRTTNNNKMGDEWGCAALWALLPWVKTNAEVRGFLETLAAQGGRDQSTTFRFTSEGQRVPMWHKGPRTAADILRASQGGLPQLLKNPSFEDGLAEWSEGPYAESSEMALHGEKSLRVKGEGDFTLSQIVPYQTGAYYLQLNALLEGTGARGEISLTATVLSAEGTQMGLILPAGTVSLRSGAWSTCVVPIVLEKLSLPPAAVRIEIHFKNFAKNDVVFLDDLGVFQVDTEERDWYGAGPDGM